MRTVLASLLVGATLATAGCWPHTFFQNEPSVVPLETPKVVPTPVAPVTADQVNAGNAREMAQALLDEIERDQGKQRR